MFLLFWGNWTFHIRFARTFWLLLVGMLKARCLLLSVDGEAQHGELLVIFMKPLLVARRPRNITLNYQLRLQNYPSIWCIWLFSTLCVSLGNEQRKTNRWCAAELVISMPECANANFKYLHQLKKKKTLRIIEANGSLSRALPSYYPNVQNEWTSDVIRQRK